MCVTFCCCLWITVTLLGCHLLRSALNIRLKLTTSLATLDEINIITSYTLELSSYEGYSVYFSQSDKDAIQKTVALIDIVLTRIRMEISTAKISLSTKNIEIAVKMLGDLNSISTVFALLYNSSSSTTNSTEISLIVTTISNFAATLQSLGMMSNFSLVIILKF